MQVAGVSSSSGSMYQQALTHLHQQRFELAFVAAKQALDAAAGHSVESSSNSTRPRPDSVVTATGLDQIQQALHSAQCCAVLAAAAAGMGDAEMAYCLYAQGYASAAQTAAFSDKLRAHERRQGRSRLEHHDSGQPQQQQQQAELQELIKQLAAGKLSMLTAMREIPHEQQQQQQWQQHPGSKRYRQLQERFSLSAATGDSSSSSNHKRVFCVSDLHVDAPGGHNLAWVKRINSNKFKNDVLIVAGDVGDTVAAVQTAFQCLTPRFARVIWVPGNHECWIRSGSKDHQMYPDSICKIMALRQIADTCGVDIGPVQVSDDVIIVPLMSWYNCHFDVSDPRPGSYRHDSFCRWPVPDATVWQMMMNLNTQTLELVRQRLMKPQTAATPDTGNLAVIAPGTAVGRTMCRESRPSQQQLLLQQEQQHRNLTCRLLRQAHHHHQWKPFSAQSSSASSICGKTGSVASINSSSSKVTWNHDGVLSVKSARKVPGLQINLQPRSRQHKQQQQQQPVFARSHQKVVQNPAVQLDRPQSCSGALTSEKIQGSQKHSVQPAEQQPLCSQQQESAHHEAPAIAAARPPTAVAPPSAVPVPPHPSITVITVSHFLPHPSLPHNTVSELSKAMGCVELQQQIEQVGGQIHVYGHSHINTDVTLPTPVEGACQAASAVDINNTCSHPGHVHARGQKSHCIATAVPGAADNSETSSQGLEVAMARLSNDNSSSPDTPGRRRYVQYALGAVDARGAGLYCLWDGDSLCSPGCLVSLTG